MTATFTDFESYAEAIQDADLNVRLLHPFERSWSIQRRALGSLRVQHGIEGSGLLTQGTVTPNGWGLYIQRSGNPVPLNGKLLSNNSIALLPPRCEFCFSGQGLIEWYSVFIPSILLSEAYDSTVQSRSAEVITVRNHLLNRLELALRAAFDVTESDCSATPSEFVLEALSEDLISAFRQILDAYTYSKRPVERKAAVNRQLLISQVVNLINDSSAWELSVPELAQFVDVSQRTLLTAFRDLLGVTPQTYLISARLHRVRRLLLVNDPENTTIAAAASEFGFFDLGRFAGRYLHLFGEHPSATLRRRV